MRSVTRSSVHPAAAPAPASAVAHRFFEQSPEICQHRFTAHVAARVHAGLHS